MIYRWYSVAFIGIYRTAGSMSLSYCASKTASMAIAAFRQEMTLCVTNNVNGYLGLLLWRSVISIASSKDVKAIINAQISLGRVSRNICHSLTQGCDSLAHGSYLSGNRRHDTSVANLGLYVRREHRSTHRCLPAIHITCILCKVHYMYSLT